MIVVFTFSPKGPHVMVMMWVDGRAEREVGRLNVCAGNATNGTVYDTFHNTCTSVELAR